jgi:hypothetical protein
VILDCCFSEAAARAFIGMASDLNQQVAAIAAKDLGDDQPAPARGTLLLCSSPVGEVSMGAPNAERTLFTGAVLEVLQKGAERRPPYLSFADLRDEAFHRMMASFGRNAPRPVLHQVNSAQGDLTRTPAFPNRAAAASVTSPVAPSLPKSTRPRESSQPAARPPLPTHDSYSAGKIVTPLRSVNKKAAFGVPRELKGNDREAARLHYSAGDQRNAEREAKGLVDNGVRLGMLGRSEEAIAVYDDLLTRFGAATEVPVRQQVATALVYKASKLRMLGRSEEEIAVYDDLLARFGAATEVLLREQVATALVNKAFRLGMLGRSNEEQIAVYDDFLARFGTATELPRRQQVATALASKGLSLAALGRSEEAIAVYDDFLARFGATTDLSLRQLVATAKYDRDRLRKSWSYATREPFVR